MVLSGFLSIQNIKLQCWFQKMWLPTYTAVDMFIEQYITQDINVGVGKLTWHWLFLQVVVKAVSGEEVKAHPWSDSPCPTPPLERIGFGHPHCVQTLHTFTGVISGSHKINIWVQNFLAFSYSNGFCVEQKYVCQ